MKIFICLALVAAVSASPSRARRGVIQEAEEKGVGEHSSSGYHHEIEHEHAKSHQSIKLEHFHPVPVYIKKEHVHLLKHPVEKGKSAHTLKQIHPKTEHHHGYGLVLENHRYEHDSHGGHKSLGGSNDHGFSDHSDHISEIEHIPEQHEAAEQGEGAGIAEDQGWVGMHPQHHQLASYESEGAEDLGGQYHFKAIDLSHLGEESEGEGY